MELFDQEMIEEDGRRRKRERERRRERKREGEKEKGLFGRGEERKDGSGSSFNTFSP